MGRKKKEITTDQTQEDQINSYPLGEPESKPEENELTQSPDPETTVPAISHFIRLPDGSLAATARTECYLYFNKGDVIVIREGSHLLDVKKDVVLAWVHDHYELVPKQ